MSFSLRSLLLTVPIVALGVSGYVFQLKWANDLAYTACVAALLIGTVAALFGREPRRFFWAGFAALGWGYWYLAFEAIPNPSPAMTAYSVGAYSANPNALVNTPLKEFRFISSDILDFFERHIKQSLRIGKRVMAQLSGTTYYSGVILEGDGSTYLVKWDDGSPPTRVVSTGIQPFAPFTRVGAHSLFCLLFAVLGGAAASWVLGDRRSASAKPANE